MRATDRNKISRYGAVGASDRTGTVSVFKKFQPKQHLHEPWAHISGRRDSELLRVNPFCYIVNAGGGTRGDSEFRRPEMWAL
jgi:hypothetical protein